MKHSFLVVLMSLLLAGCGDRNNPEVGEGAPQGVGMEEGTGAAGTERETDPDAIIVVPAEPTGTPSSLETNQPTPSRGGIPSTPSQPDQNQQQGGGSSDADTGTTGGGIGGQGASGTTGGGGGSSSQAGGAQQGQQSGGGTTGTTAPSGSQLSIEPGSPGTTQGSGTTGGGVGQPRR